MFDTTMKNISVPRIFNQNENPSLFNFILYNENNQNIAESTALDNVDDLMNGIITFNGLSAGNYTLTLYGPSGNDEDGDGIGDDTCEESYEFTLTEPPIVEIFVDADNSNQLCYLDQNGGLIWNGDFITGGCGYSTSTSDCFGSPCTFSLISQFTGYNFPTIGVDGILASNGDLYYGPYIDGELQNANNLAAGTYSITVKDVFGCESEPVEITITEPDPVEIADDNNDGIGAWQGIYLGRRE